ncbi:hypothetical protein ABEF92_005432 [Exophiala dermatitidis]|uniref:Survival Motor Neuron Gemin2-binding domain-containing protein n=1 Tax=Exophiala dermatitidis (strain ATCC 34100 / CBS 525.76 / NIH/UT8656) TaxID=858893 RepID=H6BX12_EXODN|nr:hypothetical protein, variant [Exophiala dermatitidis NIH/UT8656]EHY56168.1 hypothetical protein, variant [Exophiala dermatitidis NIH/UT8656]
MPKNKKAKTKHYPSKNSAELSQAEIWDDSALIRSWNDAVAEYEYYHSIHARGEDVEEILRKAEMDELAENGTGALSTEWQQVNSGQTDLESDARPISGSTAVAAGATAAGRASPESQEDGEIEDGELEDDLEAAREALSRKVLQTELSAPQVPAETPAEQEISQHVAENMASQVPSSSANKPKPMIGPSLPPAAVEAPGPSAEQTLENIKMAYYWAGYYSGLYDGQRQAQASAPPPPPPQP